MVLRFFIVVLILGSCNSESRREPVIIDIQPFSDISSQYATHVYQELKKLYPQVNLLKAIPLPFSAYYPERNRYRADSLIRYLKRNTAEGHVTIGLSSRDISSTKGEIKDYGIMGLGFRPGSACVVSTFRLSKSNLTEQLFKVAVHELGHTQGLEHCENRSCYMRDAKGGNPTDEERGFCVKCKQHLMARGWTFETESK